MLSVFAPFAVAAEIVAAKLFAAPLGMVFLSWANVFRPKVSSSLAADDVAGVRRLTWISVSGVFGIVLVYGVCLVLAYPMLESHVLGQKYVGLHGDIAWWGVFFCASGISSVCNGVLLAGGRFQQSFHAAAISSAISIPMMAVLGAVYAKDGLMLGLVMGEATYALVLFLGMRRLLQRVTQHPHRHQLRRRSAAHRPSERKWLIPSCFAKPRASPR